MLRNSTLLIQITGGEIMSEQYIECPVEKDVDGLYGFSLNGEQRATFGECGEQGKCFQPKAVAANSGSVAKEGK